MVLTPENAGALIPDYKLEETMETKTIRVLRAFCIEGKTQEVGKLIEGVRPSLAAELVNNKKAELVEPPKPSPEIVKVEEETVKTMEEVGVSASPAPSHTTKKEKK